MASLAQLQQPCCRGAAAPRARRVDVRAQQVAVTTVTRVGVVQSGSFTVQGTTRKVRGPQYNAG